MCGSPRGASTTRDDKVGARLAMTIKKRILGKRETQQSTPSTKAAGFADDFGGFQAVGEGIYLVDNEQAHRAESTKSAAKTNAIALLTISSQITRLSDTNFKGDFI